MFKKMLVPVEKPLPEPESPVGESPSDAQIGSAKVAFRGGDSDTNLYQRGRLRSGNRVIGPALVLQMDSTTVVTPGWCGRVDSYGNLILEPC